MKNTWKLYGHSIQVEWKINTNLKTLCTPRLMHDKNTYKLKNVDLELFQGELTNSERFDAKHRF